MNRSVTAYADRAEAAATALGGFVNGSAWTALNGRPVVLVTVPGRAASLKSLPAFRRLKEAGGRPRPYRPRCPALR